MYTNNLKVIISEGPLKGLTPDHVAFAFVIPMFILMLFLFELIHKRISSDYNTDKESKFDRKFILINVAMCTLMIMNMFAHSFFNPPAIIQDVSSGQIVATGNMRESQRAVNKTNRVSKNPQQYRISEDIMQHLDKKRDVETHSQDISLVNP